ncbi:MAG: ribosomal protein S18-alanine N-acetyltransferase [Vallitaleaceae bacterium]|nr:ribosomal protein S18-alanine N-acetyltransferase [Vallitaleaceae bacterium]
MEIYRPMTAFDVDAVYNIEVEAFSVPWTYEAIKGELVNPKAIYIVAEIDDIVRGYAGLWQIIDEGYITNIAVDDAFRHRGIGYELVKKLEVIGREKGIDRFTLEVRESNDAAIGLYKKMGFEVCGKRINFYDRPKEDAIIMWLN